MARSPVFAGAAAVGALVFLSATARAQLGSGWTEDRPVRRLQIRGCGSHNASGGVETFGLTCADTGSDNRAEQRIENDYTSGMHQFEGEVRVVSLPGTNVSLKQTFMPNNGAFLMLAVSTGGRLYSVGDNAELATGIVGRWVRINTIHNVSAGTHEIYADGMLKYTKTGGRQVAWHDKYGTYRLGSGRGPITAEWRNVRFWSGGRSGGGSPPSSPPPDAGAADASTGGGADAAGEDSGGGSGGTGAGGSSAGGSGGSGGSGGAGTGGSSGSGGRAGSGGTGGGGAGSAGGSSVGTGGATGTASGGSAGSTTGGGGRGGTAGSGGGGTAGAGTSDPGPASAGCAMGGAGGGGGALALLALAFVLGRSLRRRTGA